MEPSNISARKVEIVSLSNLSGTESLHEMRQLTRAIVESAGYPTETADAAELMASELAANAAEHGNGGVVRYAIAGGALRILAVNAAKHAAPFERARAAMGENAIHVVHGATLPTTPALRTAGHEFVTFDPRRRGGPRVREVLRRRVMLTALAAGFAHDDIIGLGYAADELHMHGPDGPRAVEVYVGGGELCISVLRDEHGASSRVDHDAESGRGLNIVGALAERRRGIFASCELPRP